MGKRSLEQSLSDWSVNIRRDPLNPTYWELKKEMVLWALLIVVRKIKRRQP